MSITALPERASGACAHARAAPAAAPEAVLAHPRALERRGAAEAGRRRARAGGVFVTDVTNASRTGLMDLESLSWHEPTLAYFGVPAGALPAIVSNAEVYGRVAAGPLAGVPIAGARAGCFPSLRSLAKSGRAEPAMASCLHASCGLHRPTDIASRYAEPVPGGSARVHGASWSRGGGSHAMRLLSAYFTSCSGASEDLRCALPRHPLSRNVCQCLLLLDAQQSGPRPIQRPHPWPHPVSGMPAGAAPVQQDCENARIRPSAHPELKPNCLPRGRQAAWATSRRRCWASAAARAPRRARMAPAASCCCTRGRGASRPRAGC